MEKAGCTLSVVFLNTFERRKSLHEKYTNVRISIIQPDTSVGNISSVYHTDSYICMLHYKNMQIITASKNTSVISLARGEELFASLLEWAANENVQGATFTGIGAADHLEIAYYNLSAKSFERQTIQQEVEIVSLTGNIGYLKKDRALHIHGVFSRRDLSTFGGHLFSARISGACELHITTLPHRLDRAYDETTGLNLLTCATM